MALKKLTFPDNSSQDIHDARITGVDSSPTASSTNVVTSGGVYNGLKNIVYRWSQSNTITGIDAQDLDDAYTEAAALIDAGRAPVLIIGYDNQAYTEAFLLSSDARADDNELVFTSPNYWICLWNSGNISVGPRNLEVTTNRVTSLSSSSSDLQYPSAKCVYDGLIGASPKIYVGTCETAAATVAKVVTVETFPTSNSAPLVGTTIAVKFSYTNSASSPTFAVNGTTAARVYYDDGLVGSSLVNRAGYKDRYCYYIWDGTYWVWLNWSVDNDTVYLLRYNSTTRNMANKLYRYRLLFSSADRTTWVAANATNSSSSDTSKTVTTEKIDPFGPIVMYNSTTTISEGSAPSNQVLYLQSSVNIGYSFNNTGSAPSMTSKQPIYVKAAPQSDGSVIIDSTTPYVQTLPSTDDGKVYIYLGLCFNGTSVELQPYHPAYYYKDGQIRLWTNAASSGGSAGTLDTTATTAQSTNASEALSGSVTLHKIAKTGTYSDLIGTPSIPDTTTVAGWGYAKYYLCQDEAAYTAIQNKDSGTLYLIPET